MTFVIDHLRLGRAKPVDSGSGSGNMWLCRWSLWLAGGLVAEIVADNWCWSLHSLRSLHHAVWLVKSMSRPDSDMHAAAEGAQY